MPLLERALSAIDERDSPTRVSLLVRLAAAARDDPSRDRRVALAEEALDIARRSGDPVTLAAAIEGHWIAVEGPEVYLSGDAVEVADELIALGKQAGDNERVFAGHDHRLHCLWMLCGRPASTSSSRRSARSAPGSASRQRWDVGTGETMLALMEGALRGGGAAADVFFFY